MEALDSLRCAVIGAGLVGLCTALALQRQGRKVTLIDAGRPGEGASWGNAGFLATESIDPLSTWGTLKSAPRLLLDRHGPLVIPKANLPASLPWLARFTRAAGPAMVNASRTALADLNRQAVPAWQACLSSIGQSDLLVRCGYLLAWESAAGLSAARREVKHLQAWDQPVELIGRQQLDDMEPNLAGRMSHALHFPEAYRVRDPAWLGAALFEAYTSAGGVFMQQPVAAIRVVDAHRIELQLGLETRMFSKVALCAGASSGELLKTLSMSVPLMAERGYHLSVQSSETFLNRPVCSVDRRVFLSPLNSGFRVVGISELGGLALPAQPARFETLRHHARQLFPHRSELINQASEWMGKRPTLPDSLPVIDVHPDHAHLGFAFGNQHLGLTQAAITGRLLSQRLMGMPCDLNLKPFRITRF